jgi:uncharacterized protein
LSNQLEILFQLQMLDTKLLDKQRTVGRYEAELAARRAAIATCNAKIDALLASRKDAVAQRAFAERKVEDLQEALKQKRQRAQKARNEKEVHAGHSEVMQAQEEIRDAETAQLEAMARVEELEAAIEVAKGERTELESEDHRHVTEAEQRIDALRSELGAEREARDAAAAQVEGGMRKKYESLLERRQGVAVVEIDGTGCCAGCHVQIPPQTLIEVRRTGALRVCPMCQRILFVPLAERTYVPAHPVRAAGRAHVADRRQAGAPKPRTARLACAPLECALRCYVPARNLSRSGSRRHRKVREESPDSIEQGGR